MVSPTTLSIASLFLCSKKITFHIHTWVHTHRGTRIDDVSIYFKFYFHNCMLIFRVCSFLYLEYFYPYFPPIRNSFFKLQLESHILVRPSLISSQGKIASILYGPEHRFPAYEGIGADGMGRTDNLALWFPQKTQPLPIIQKQTDCC